MSAFAIPALIDLAVQGSSIAKLDVGKIGGVWQGVVDTFRHWNLVLRCSAIGTFIAVIPGMGAATTQWLAYAHAVQSSPGKERFGKGAVEGVLGPGAANNSTLGGSLVTTIAFGVPASVSTAILMGAFLIQGLVPGPSMLTPEPKGHLGVTFSMVWTIVISNIITVALCFLFLKQLVRVTQIRGTLLIPFILTLIYVGAFAEKNVFEDLLVVLVFGGIGWVMAKLDWPRPPLLLGLVLGPLAENKLFLSTDNYGIAWRARPAVLLLLAIIAGGLMYPFWSEWRRRVKEGIAREAPEPARPIAVSTGRRRSASRSSSCSRGRCGKVAPSARAPGFSPGRSRFPGSCLRSCSSRAISPAVATAHRRLPTIRPTCRRRSQHVAASTGARGPSGFSSRSGCSAFRSARSQRVFSI